MLEPAPPKNDATPRRLARILVEVCTVTLHHRDLSVLLVCAWAQGSGVISPKRIYDSVACFKIDDD